MRRLLVVAVAALALAGCAGQRNSLGTGSSACFRALPAARAAVHQQGRYLGVRQVKASAVAKRHAEFAAFGSETLCIVAFQGSFEPGSVNGANPAKGGAYAVVAVDAKTAKAVAAFVVDRLPLRFTHPV
ncbi:MAG TPA: lipoprotein [Actinomycetota bacterium]|nr:lipoprotein [Actinomycetota bacterium]